MAWSITADQSRFDQACDSFAKRVVLSDEERKQIPLSARSRAFWIAGVAQVDVVQSVHTKLLKAIEEGTPLEDFKKQVRDELTKAWGKDDPKRIELIFRNAMQGAYNAGRWHQMREPSVLRFRPYWMFDAVLDSRTSKICSACNGTILPAEDSFWDRCWPPLHHACRSSVVSLRKSEAERRGISHQAPTAHAQQGFGASPRAATEWRPDPAGRDQRLMAELERKRRELAQRPALPPLPKIFEAPPVGGSKPSPLPPLRPEYKTRQQGTIRLTLPQQRARQIAEHLGGSYATRAKAGYIKRRAWLQWEWVCGSNRKASALAKHAAEREFGLSGTPWYGNKPYQLQAADITRTQRDLRRMYDETQAWFRRRGITHVTLYRGIHGNQDHPRNTIESWTTTKKVAQEFADRGSKSNVITMTFPVEKVLMHHKSPGWVDGPFGPQEEYLIMP